MLGKQRFSVRVWLLAMCRGELSPVIAWLISKCLWSGGSSSEELKKCPPPFPCSPVVHEWLWKKTQIEKKRKSCEGTLFLWLHIHYIHLGSVKFEHSVSWITYDHYLYIYIYINSRQINYKYIIATNSFMCLITIFRLYKTEEDCLMLHLCDC